MTLMCDPFHVKHAGSSVTWRLPRRAPQAGTRPQEAGRRGTTLTSGQVRTACGEDWSGPVHPRIHRFHGAFEERRYRRLSESSRHIRAMRYPHVRHGDPAVPQDLARLRGDHTTSLSPRARRSAGAPWIYANLCWLATHRRTWRREDRREVPCCVTTYAIQSDAAATHVQRCHRHPVDTRTQARGPGTSCRFAGGARRLRPQRSAVVR